MMISLRIICFDGRVGSVRPTYRDHHVSKDVPISGGLGCLRSTTNYLLDSIYDLKIITAASSSM